ESSVAFCIARETEIAMAGSQVPIAANSTRAEIDSDAIARELELATQADIHRVDSSQREPREVEAPLRDELAQPCRALKHQIDIANVRPLDRAALHIKADQLVDVLDVDGERLVE